MAEQQFRDLLQNLDTVSHSLRQSLQTLSHVSQTLQQNYTTLLSAPSEATF